MLDPLARCFLPLLAAVPSDASNPFEHPPFTLPVFRANLLLSPLASDEQLQLYDDESLDVDGHPRRGLSTEAGQGFQFSQDAAASLGSTGASVLSDDSQRQANHFYRTWFWAEIKRLRALKYDVPQAVKRVDLASPKTILNDGRTDEGWLAYRQLILVLLNRPGGVMRLVEDTMVRHRATPAERWRDARDENRVSL
jgi:hypothetical protein